MKNLIIRTVTGAIFVALVVLSFFMNPLFFDVLFLSFSFIATWEYLQMVAKTDATPQIILPLVLTALLFSTFQLMQYSIYASLIILLVTLVLILGVPIVELFRKRSQPLHNVALSLFPLVWITLPIGIIGMWTHFFEAYSVVLALFVIIWA
ncbi:MAG: phosphatidate cytidylyltransferase, partial [Bacteroidales bacterium]